MTIFKKHIFWTLSLMVLNAHALGAIAFDLPSGYEMDEKEKIGKVALVSGKKDDTRFYEAKMSVEMNADIENALEAVLNFDERCNNEQALEKKILGQKEKMLAEKLKLDRVCGHKRSQSAPRKNQRGSRLICCFKKDL